MSFQWRYLSKELALAVVAFVVALVFLLYWYANGRARIEQAFIQDQMAIMSDKRAAVEGMLAGIYQNVRTITLLPSVRAIAGSNRVGESEDVVASGRFTKEGWETVQQIYNNLASRVNVSEVYAVIDGLDAGKGEIPFFMFDTVVFGGKTSMAEEGRPADFPDESEDEEYRYFPRQIEAIKAKHPRFDFARLDDVPAFLSPLMRTCDNTQYLSSTTGDAKETHGFLYSVPFYGETGEFRGVISAILRANVLEALLMDVPFVPVTEADKSEQKKAGWTLPAAKPYVLSNQKYGIRIADRRHTDLDALIAKGQPGRNTFRLKLDVPGDAPWELAYYLPEEEIQAALAAHKRSFYILLTVVLGAIVAAGVTSLLLSRMRGRLGGRTEEVARIVHAVSDGDLKVNIDANVAPASVLGSMHAMVGELSGHMRAIDIESKQIAQSSFQIAEISQRIVEQSHKEQERSAEVREATSALSETAAAVLGLTEAVRGSADEARDSANGGMRAVRDNIDEMALVVSEVESAASKIGALNQANQQIHTIVEAISSITDQTSLLALNAAIEAARAGEQGRGFAVVADEVRKLANNASSATSEISTITAELTDLIAANNKAMQRVIERVRSSMTKAEGTHSAFEQLARVVEQNAEVAHRISGVGSEQQTRVASLQERLATLSGTLEQNAMAVHTTGAIGQDLFEVTERLCQLIRHFSFDNTWSAQRAVSEHRRAPRVSRHLLVRVDDRGTEREAITADFSMTGMRLRVPLPLESKVGETLKLQLLIPSDDLSEYVQQSPLAISAKLLWTRPCGAMGHYYGFDFVAPDVRQRGQLEHCFLFYNQQPTYS